ncbi:hypothetical protein [Urbifossiella limnaea]|uniref:Uncharacterized protein n=1 Tax=Urbifossiella limnaea TaxID=2528023 RepID=A0A517XNY7_9BACT|nr:hypothetical protein [Urbifossiella limnaea]QDU19192.1 hypothetical protein ETAA1_10960 [Urbifossiella limnaea]
MRRLLAAAALGVAAGTASAQTGTATGTTTTSRPGGGSAMPGQVVGSSYNLAGSAPQPVGSPVGSPVGTPLPPAGTPITRPYDPRRPNDVFRGTGLSPNQVIAPISAFPPLPGQEKNLIDRMYDKLDSFWSINIFARQAEPLERPPTVTPGIFRRNRERHDDRMWRRD